MTVHKMLRRIIPATAALLGFGQPALAQDAVEAETVVLDRNDADPALWKLSDNDTTIWMFGTMHVLKPDLVWFDDAVRDAFDASDELVLEMVEPPEDEIMATMLRYGMRSDGSKLSDSLTEEQKAKLAQASAQIGIPAAGFDAMKPWLAAIMISMSPLEKLGYKAESGVEAVLQTQAAEKGTSVSGLETFEQQIGFFSAIEEDAQIEYLMAAIDQLDNAPAMFRDMEEYWAVGDVAATAELVNEGMEETPGLNKALLIDRNRNWAEWIASRMEQPGTVFLAVGAGHLAGEGSVQAMLAERGMNVERVAY